MNSMEEFFVISVSGVKYTLFKEDVRKHPDTLLSELADWKPWTLDGNPTKLPLGFRYIPSTKEFYVLRSPKLFETILYYYATGVFHVPAEICFAQIEEEISFWKLRNIKFAPCCSDAKQLSDENVSISPSENVEDFHCGWRKRLWDMWERPTSSWKAKLLASITVTFTLVSIVNMIVGSIPGLQYCSREYEKSHNGTSVRFYLESMELFVYCRGTLVFLSIDAVCTIWFAIEFGSRLIVCPHKRVFMRNPMNVIDLFSVFPFFFELIIWAMFQDNMPLYNSHTVLVVLRFLRLLRIARLFRMFKYSDDLKILGGTFNLARRELLMLTIFTVFGLLMFATLLYYIEKDEEDTHFSSIPASCWWAIVTLTTAGYGDVTPRTTFGKVVAGIACVSGILIMALPISVMVENFSNNYTKKIKPNNNDSKKITRRCRSDSLNSYGSYEERRQLLKTEKQNSIDSILLNKQLQP